MTLELTPVDDLIIGITLTVFCFHIAHISFASSWYLLCFSVIVLAILCVFGTAMSIKYVVFFFIRESYVRSVSRYCFIHNYAAIPVLLLLLLLLLLLSSSSINYYNDNNK